MRGFLAEALPQPGVWGSLRLFTYHRRCCACWQRKDTFPIWVHSPASPDSHSSSHGRGSTCKGHGWLGGACEPGWAEPGASWGAQCPKGLKVEVGPNFLGAPSPSLLPGCSPCLSILQRGALPAGSPAHQSVWSTGPWEPPKPQ